MLLGCLVGWLVGCLLAWLVGWLVGWLRNTITIHALGDGQDSWNECYLFSHNCCVAKQTLAAISSQLRAHLFNHVGFGGISSCPSQTPWWMDGRKRSAGMSTSIKLQVFLLPVNYEVIYCIVYDYDVQPKEVVRSSKLKKAAIKI